MRRPTLSTKLFAAALPLVLAVAALLALTVRSDLAEIRRTEAGAELGRVWQPLIDALTSVETEIATIDAVGATDQGAVMAARRATDQAINELRSTVEGLDAVEAAGKHITSGRSWLSAARRELDLSALDPNRVHETDPLTAYESAGRELVSVGQLLPAESDDANLGRELLAVVKLAEAKLAADTIIFNTSAWEHDPSDRAALSAARSAFVELEAVLGEFEAIAPDEWASDYRQSGYSVAVSGFRSQLERTIRAADQGTAVTFDTAGFAELAQQGLDFQTDVSQQIVDRATAQADSVRSAAMLRLAITLGAVLLAALTAWLLTRSITRRVRAASDTAHQVATEQLPALVEAIRDPRGKAVLPDIEPLDDRGQDELAELATAFNSIQGTLVDVAQQQVEVMRRGVSEIFVTMARRNRSLIDRQLALLDEFEAEVDDPAVLANYYQLDHMATRMRRNAESLLVLANAEPKRRRVKATEIDDVVRAAIGEVEDYRRIEVEALESLQVRGQVVADVSHMLAELLDNATSFSPPDSIVRVGGRRAGNSYMIRIVDNGVGIGAERLQELNQLLREPPVVGLSVEPTLGLSVVSLLANKHGIGVTLSAGNPGLTVDVLLPASLFGPIDVPQPGEQPVAASPAAPQPAPDTEVDPLLVAAISDITVEDAPAAEPVAVEPSLPAAPELAETAFDTLSLNGTLHEAAPAPEPTVEGATGELPRRHGADDPTPQQIAAETVANIDAVLGLGDAVAFEAPPIEPSVEPPIETPPSEAPPVDAPNAEPPVEQPIAEAPPAPAESQFDVPVVEHDVHDGRETGDEDPTSELPLPPPPAAPLPGPGLQVPPAPPILAAGGPSRQPVTPDHALPVPKFEPAPEPPPLPTRSRGNPSGPAAEVDRLEEERSVAASSAPSALRDALSAFDRGRKSGTDALPVRTRTATVESDEEPASIAASRLDPDALRQRLRAFQTEFHTGLTDAEERGHDSFDLGGDR